MRCKQCGALISPGGGFCPRCGADIGHRQEAFIRCRNCGRRVRAGTSLCPACGTELRRSWRRVVRVALTLLLLGVGYYMVVNVVTISRIKQEIDRLPTISLAALLPPPIPTSTAVPAPSGEARPAPTRLPTATPDAGFTPAAPTVTETATPAATAEPTATATPAFLYPAVQLAAPANGIEIAASSIVFSWQSVGTLATDEWYRIRFRYPVSGQMQYAVARLKETSWEWPASSGMPDPAQPVCEWDVQVVNQVIVDGSSQDVPLSPPSETWTFTWR